MKPRAIALFLLLGGSVDAHAAAYSLPRDGEDLIGSTTFEVVNRADTFAQVAHRLGVGWGELVSANRAVDPWLPADGARIEVPTAFLLPDGPRQGIVINLAEYRLYYYMDGRVITYPVGIGRQDLETPFGSTRVVARIEQPSWTPSAAARKERAERGDPLPAVVPPGPDNPLGEYALQLAMPGIFIHGTNQSFGVGQTVSRGCIRLYPEHIATLIEIVPVGTPVELVYQPGKGGWRDGEVFVEAHEGPYTLLTSAQAVGWVRSRLGAAVDFDVAALTSAVELRSGVPVQITHRVGAGTPGR
jgi:L,D-transpeptidase ErfK/SrfK